MARKRSSILPMDQSPARRQAGKHRAAGLGRWFWLALLAAVLGLAWFDGGEEPIHPIAQAIPVPGGE